VSTSAGSESPAQDRTAAARSPLGAERSAQPTARWRHAPAVVLIGPMAAGKTSVGRALASRLDLEFADLDVLIEARSGRSIPEIFETDGEAAFRDLEASVLVEALATHHGVLALGGGAAMRPASGELLRGGPIVWLRISDEAVARRISGGRGRPMLAGADALQRWRDVTAAREPVYRDLSRWQIDTDRGSPKAVARLITDMMEEDLLPVPKEKHP